MAYGRLLAVGRGQRQPVRHAQSACPCGDSLLSERALRTLRDWGTDPVVAVIGAAAEQVRAAVPWDDAVIVENPGWESGMGSSLRAGLAALDPTDVDAALILLVDTSGVDAPG